MRAFIAILILLTGHQAMAAVGDIRCMVRDFEIQGSQTIEKGAVELKVTAKNAVALRMEADLGEKSYVLSGDLVTGDFLLSQVWGPEYTVGRNTTGSFTSTGRLQMSEVDGNRVLKFECRKTLASSYPNE